MTYFYCEDCGNIFSEEDAKVRVEDWGYGTREIYVCPECFNKNITDAEKCECCGEPIAPTEKFCEICKHDLYKIWDKAVEAVLGIADIDKDYMDCQELFLDYLDNSGVL